MGYGSDQLGAKIKHLRSHHSLSQQKLAEVLGVPRPAISQIENGMRSVTAEELIKLSKIFSLTVDSLLDLHSEPEVILPKKGTRKKKSKQEIRINVPQKNLEKFKEVLLYILDKVGSKANIGETVIYKLLYFIDFNFYEKHEEQLMGAQYMKNRYGPTPVEFAKIVEQMTNKHEIEKVKSNFFEHPQTKYLPLRKPDLSKLTAEELTVIEDVLNRLSDMNATQISNYSHEDIPWKTAKEGSIIEYESVFYRTPGYSVREYEEHVP
jgi:transcriptional regulator with XRE-family HTH domain